MPNPATTRVKLPSELKDRVQELAKARRRTAHWIMREAVELLESHPEVGRPVEELSVEFREWVIEFGGGAYVTPYRYDGKEVVILAVQHGREAGY